VRQWTVKRAGEVVARFSAASAQQGLSPFLWKLLDDKEKLLMTVFVAPHLVVSEAPADDKSSALGK